MSKPKTDNACDWLTPGRFTILMAVLVAVAYPGVLAGTGTFFYRDYGLAHYPVAFHQRASFWLGETPLWDPLNNLGLPFLAQWNTMTLYPPSLFYLLLPLPWSLGVFVVAHLVVAGVGMYCLAFRWTGSRLGASVAGVAFAFNGAMLHSLMWTDYNAGLAWMPWVVLAAESAWREGGRRKIILAAGAGAMQVLSGAPEPVALTWGLLGLLWLVQWFQAGEHRWRMAGRFAAVAGLVGGLTAIQMLPFLDLVSHSQRGEANFSETRWAMPGWGWANFLVPLFHCTPSILGVFSQDQQQLFSSYYLGIGALALAATACLNRRRNGGRVYLLAAIAVGGLLLAMGDNSVVYPAICKIIPGLKLMRYPVKFVILTVFCLPPLAAFGIQELVEGPPAERLKSMRHAVATGIALMLAAVGVLVYARRFPATGESWPTTLESGVSRLIFLGAILGGALFLARARPGRALGLGGLALVLLTALDGWTHTPNQNPLLTPRAYAPLGIGREVTARLGESRAMLHPKLQAFLSHAAIADPLEYYTGVRRSLFMDCNLLEGIPTTGGFFPLYLPHPARVTALLETAGDGFPEPLADFLGISQVSAADTSFTWSSRTNWMPLVTAGQRPIFADGGETLKGLASTNFDPRGVVYLPVQARASINVSKASHPRITVAGVAAHMVRVEVSAEEPAMLVIAQAYYHPWHAYVDGKPTPVWEANYGFQAIETPAGPHQVRLVYQDSAFELGRLVSAATLLCALIGWFWRARSPGRV